MQIGKEYRTVYGHIWTLMEYRVLDYEFYI